MKRSVRISLVAALVAACALSTASPHVHAAAIDDGMPDQSSLDSSQNSQSQGNWSDLAGGVAGRYGRCHVNGTGASGFARCSASAPSLAK